MVINNYTSQIELSRDLFRKYIIQNLAKKKFYYSQYLDRYGIF